MDLSGIVLAGGASRRLGRDKALEPINGEPMLFRVVRRLSELCSQIVIVVNGPERAESLKVPDNTRTVVDAYPNSGSLGGIFTGIKEVDTNWGLVVACDMPFLNVDLLRYMAERREGYDVVVPVLNGFSEPTHAFYSKKCLRLIEPKLKARDLKITKFFGDVRVNYVPEDVVEAIDSEKLSFFNVNNQVDLDRATKLAAEGL